MELKGKIAVITGTRGLGAAIAEAYARAGATVVCASRTPPAADHDAPSGVQYDRVDVTDLESVTALMERVSARYGRLDVVVANAGVSRDATLARISPEAWAETVGTNVTGTLYTMQAAVRTMRALGNGGRIITLSSSMATRPVRGAGPYSASKAAIEALTRTAAIEFGAHGVTVACLSPGVLDVGLGADLQAADVWQTYRARIALGRPGTGEEIARVAVMLAMPESAYVNGSVVEVNGGMSW